MIPKLLTESQQARLLDALEAIDDLVEELTEEHGEFPDAIDHVFAIAGWAYKEAHELPVVSDGFYDH